MSFIPNNCHNLIMDLADDPRHVAGYLPQHSLSQDDLMRLSDAGMTVALEFVQWDRYSLSEAEYDFHTLDATLERVRKAGMKCLLLGPNTVPQWCPDSWYVQTQDGTPLKQVDTSSRYNSATRWGCLSPWNDEAQSYQNGFITAFCHKYNASDVLCIQSHSRDGESLLPPGVAAFYDPAAVASFREYIGTQSEAALPDPMHYATQLWLRDSLSQVLLTQQHIYCESSPHREIFLQAHPYYAAWPNSGQAYLLDYYKLIQSDVRPDTFNMLAFTAFDNGHDAYLWPFVSQLQSMGINVYTGSEWAEGLNRNTPRAIEKGIRGLVTCPIHPFNGHTRVEEWMIGALAQSRQTFVEAKEAVTA
jgi:hypothetical protein